MICKNCGANLTGTETVCPNCGAPVENVVSNETELLQPAQPVPVQPVEAAPVVEPTPVEVAPTPVVPEAPVAEPVPVQPVEAVPVVDPAPVVDPTPVAVEPTIQPVQNGFVEPAVAAMNQPVQTAAQPETPKPKDNKTLILIIALAVVAVGAVVLYFTVFAPASTPASPAPTSNNNGNNDTPVSTKTENTETYGGYTFTIPDGYTAKTSDEYGLMIGNSSVVFTVQVDYTHKYETYKTSLETKYADQKDKLVNTVNGREYLILVYSDPSDAEAKASQFVTKASDSATFVGMVVRSDYKGATETEYKTLTTILDSATEGSTSFAPGDDNDAGKNGEKIYTFTKDKFSFEEKGE